MHRCVLQYLLVSSVVTAMTIWLVIEFLHYLLKFKRLRAKCTLFLGRKTGWCLWTELLYVFAMFVDCVRKILQHAWDVFIYPCQGNMTNEATPKKVSVSTNPTDHNLKGRPQTFFMPPQMSALRNSCSVGNHVWWQQGALPRMSPAGQWCGYIALVDATRSFDNIGDVWVRCWTPSLGFYSSKCRGNPSWCGSRW